MNDLLTKIEDHTATEAAQDAAQTGLASIIIAGLIYCIALLV